MEKTKPLPQKLIKLNILTLEGLAIFLVVLVHFPLPKSVAMFLSYGLPVFIFARGYQWKERNLKEIISARILLLETYFTAGILNTILFLLVVPEQYIVTNWYNYFLNILLCKTSGNNVAINVVPLWFFFVIFFSEVLFSLIKNKKLLISIFILISFWFRVFLKFPLPFKIDLIIMAIPFYLIGYLWKKYQPRVNFLDFLLSVFGLIIISHFNGHIVWNDAKYGRNGIISFLGEVLAIIIAIYLSKIIKLLQLENFFLTFAFNALFVVSYHISIGGVVALPLIYFFNINDPIKYFEKFWFINTPITLTVVWLMIKYTPKKIKLALIGDFRKLINKNNGRSE